jgi:uncharacterized protein YoxC
MIQFNLLPDVKLQYLKVKRMQHMVITISVIAIAVSLFVLIVLIGTVDGIQKKNLSDLKSSIATDSSKLQSTPNLSKILTVQNQLNALTGLHNNKPVASRMFNYIKDLTPSAASISQINIDFTQNSVSISGNAPSLDIVDTYVDTLKFTNYTISSSTSQKPAFSSVVLSTFSRNSQGAQYTITASFDPNIFNSANSVNLTVPNIISTRSAIDQPTDLFKSNADAGGQ